MRSYFLPNHLLEFQRSDWAALGNKDAAPHNDGLRFNAELEEVSEDGNDAWIVSPSGARISREQALCRLEPVT